MDLLRWMGRTYTRFVGVSVTLLSAWMFLVNLSPRYQIWVWLLVLVSGLAGAVGGAAYLLSLDGAPRFRTRRHRVGGWVAMLAAVMLPTSLTFMLVPLVLTLLPTLFNVPKAEEGVTTS